MGHSMVAVKMGWAKSLLVGATFLLLVEVTEARQKHIGCYYGVWAYTRPGIGEFWPEDIDVSLCDVIYYGFGNVLNHTYEVSTWVPLTLARSPSRTASKRGTGTFGPQDVKPKGVCHIVNTMASVEPLH